MGLRVIALLLTHDGHRVWNYKLCHVISLVDEAMSDGDRARPGACATTGAI
jgi:hypothetical protein